MPTPEQLRQEAFADAVEQAVTVSALPLFWSSTSEPLRVRVNTKDGRQVEFRLQEVDLDGQQLVGQDPHGASQTIPLSGVQAVWHRRPLVWRSAAVWVSGGLTGALLGSTGSGLGALFGALIGLVGGSFVSWRLHDSHVMYEWQEMYSGPAA